MTFDEWLEENKERLEPLLHADTQRFAYECWLAGYEEGLNHMGKFASDLFKGIM